MKVVSMSCISGDSIAGINLIKDLYWKFNEWNNHLIFYITHSPNKYSDVHKPPLYLISLITTKLVGVWATITTKKPVQTQTHICICVCVCVCIYMYIYVYICA